MRQGHSQVKTSKTMSYLLRHGAQQKGLPMRRDGYVPLEALLSHLHGVSSADVKHIVDTSDKQRFKLTQIEGVVHIRANQGHSSKLGLDDAVMLKKIRHPGMLPVAIHGTNWSAWKMIKKSGLNKMDRRHIHMATGEPGTASVKSGARANCDVFIYVDVPCAMEQGIEFYLSDNGVILSPGPIPPTCFLKVIEARSREVLVCKALEEQPHPSERSAGCVVIAADLALVIRRKHNGQYELPRAHRGKGDTTTSCCPGMSRRDWPYFLHPSLPRSSVC